MKIEIERPAETTEELLALNALIHVIKQFDTLDELANNLSNIHVPYAVQEHLTWGFGSSHMWVHTIDRNGKPAEDRLLFIT